jgi:hypothetical protein
MRISYINLDWNRVEWEFITVPSNIVKIDQVYFEQSMEVEVKPEVKKVEKVESNEDLEAKAKEFLRDKKVKWFGLLKGDNLINRAKLEGFIA